MYIVQKMGQLERSNFGSKCVPSTRKFRISLKFLLKVRAKRAEISKLSSNLSKGESFSVGCNKRGPMGDISYYRGHWVYSLAKRVGLLTGT